MKIEKVKGKEKYYVVSGSWPNKKILSVHSTIGNAEFWIKQKQ